MSPLDAAVAAGVTALLDALGAPPLPSTGARLAALKSALGRKGLAERLQLNEHELGAFEAALSEVQRWSQSAPAAPRRADFLELASLAALQWLEVLSPRAGVAPPSNPLSTTLTDEGAAARVRALELVLRELIHESYRSQAALTARLRELFRGETVDRWSRSAAAQDLLTGMSFGDLAGLFVSREEYPRWQPALEVEHWLAMLRDRRKTLRDHLDALRLARNALAHHKPLSVTQRLLVERYSNEIFSPISRSWAEGRTAVNPQHHLDASADGLTEWVQGLTDEVNEIRDELAEVKQDLAATKGDVSALEGAVVMVLVSGLIVIATIVSSRLMPVGDVPVRSARGLAAAGFTFVLAMLRVLLNVTVLRAASGSRARAWLTGPGAKVALALWVAAWLVFVCAPLRVEW